MKRPVIAIDGPAGAGKSTVAKLVAKKLGCIYIDTGAMYRAVALAVIKSGKERDDATIVKVAEGTDVRLKARGGDMRVLMNGEDVTEKIRTPEVTALVPVVASLSPVREKLVRSQREMADGGGVVMDGRDIASHVLPGADIKIFLTASIGERARRRFAEMKAKGYDGDIKAVKEDVAARDKADSEREVSPLVRVSDAVLIDTTDMTADEAAEKISRMCE